MTGYASAQLSPGNVPTGHEGGKSATPMRLGLEIRSVNSRFLDLSFRLGEELRSHEPALRELIASRIKRGKVEVRAGVEGAAGEAAREPTMATLQRLAAVQDTVKTWMPTAAALSVAEVLRLSAAEGGQLRWTGATPCRSWRPRCSPTWSPPANVKVRAWPRCCSGTWRSCARWPTRPSRWSPSWWSSSASASWTGGRKPWRWAKAAPTPEAAQDRALTEATAFAIRIDVAEELTRLAAHVDEIERLIKKGGEIGKRLDFLIQELHREANTLGSKSAALELTKISVDMKVLIEQMREQVQNLE
jgi:uncharacterized protein YicC (UPF0701 family)